MKVYIVTNSYYVHYEGGDTEIMEVCDTFDKAFEVVKARFPSAKRRKKDGEWKWYIFKGSFEDRYLGIEVFEIK